MNQKSAIVEEEVGADSSKIDNGEMLDNKETPDTIADPEGAAERAANQRYTPQLAPEFIMRDFDWKRQKASNSVEELVATGQRAFFMVPRPDVVTRATDTAQKALDKARAALTPEDQDLAKTIAKEVKDLEYTFAGVDEWLSELVQRAVARQVASDAAFIARGVDMLNGWNPQDEAAETRKQSFTEMLFNSQHRLGILAGITDNLGANKHINLKSGMWQKMQADARKHQDKYRHPDELAISRVQNGENEKNATDAMTGGLV